MVDMLSYLVMADHSLGLGWSRQTHGLTGPAGPSWDVVTMTPDSQGYSKRYRIKSPTGWPWDISRFNGQVILDWITEKDWTSPRDYKKNVANYLDPTYGMVDGKLMFSRMINPDWNYQSNVIPKAQTGYRVYTNCAWDNQPHDVGENLQVLTGPVWIDHGGTIGMQPTMVHEYFWDGTQGVYLQKEENLYALNYGWMRWSVSLRQSDGTWKVQNISVRNTLLVQPPPATDFPCF